MNGSLTITLSRFCHQTELEELFFSRLDQVLAAV